MNAPGIMLWPGFAIVSIAGLASASVAYAQTSPQDGPLSITLPEAVEIALARSYALQNAKLDFDDAELQVDVVWAQALPRLDANATYTRNLAVPNPFAGSGAGGFFDGLNAINWLAFNEVARTDNDDTTNPIPLDVYTQRTADGLAMAGAVNGNANLFLVENNVNVGLTATQILYDNAFFAGLRSARNARELSRIAVDLETHNVVRDVAVAFYGILLAEEQVRIQDKSVARSQANVDETKKRVAQGVQPQFAQLSAEVELANLQTQRLQTQNLAKNAMDNLKRLLGIAAMQPLAVRGSLDEAQTAVNLPPKDQAIQDAFKLRPDMRQADLQVEAFEIQEDITWSQYLPVLSVFANLSYQGTIPDNRDFFFEDPPGSFMYQQGSNGPFSDNFWFPVANVGVQLTWNIFNGFETSSQLERNRIATRKARVGLAQLRTAVHLEVSQTLRDLQTARQQIQAQSQNVARAEENYRHAEIRLREGVSSPIELREASNQLDQSRLAYRQAMHDYLVAKVRYDVAIGDPPVINHKDESSP